MPSGAGGPLRIEYVKGIGAPLDGDHDARTSGAPSYGGREAARPADGVAVWRIHPMVPAASDPR